MRWIMTVGSGFMLVGMEREVAVDGLTAILFFRISANSRMERVKQLSFDWAVGSVTGGILSTLEFGVDVLLIA
jgi:hypothetical protein